MPKIRIVVRASLSITVLSLSASSALISAVLWITASFNSSISEAVSPFLDFAIVSQSINLMATV